MLLLFALPALAGSYSTDFATDDGAWEGGTVAAGHLSLVDGAAILSLGPAASLTGTLSLRKVDEGELGIGLGTATWVATYAEGGNIRLGGSSLPFPHGHRRFVTEADPVLEPDAAAAWEAGSVLHCEVHHDPASGTWFLYYTGVYSPGYGYRQIGVATSPDGRTWTRHGDGPVVPITWDLADVDGVHAHMPTVVVDPSDGTWHMFYSCYQNDVGNRLCGATSPDGLSWTRTGVALDRGAEGEFDSASLREPEVQIAPDGTWHLFYQGTAGDEHYGSTGYATSPDGATWTRHGAIEGSGKSVLQGGGLVQGPYGVEQWYNCDDALCYARADDLDWSSWEWDSDPDLTKDWAPWNSGYLQAASPWLVDDTYHLWFNAYDYGTGLEVLGHAESRPQPGELFTLSLSWDGEVLAVAMDDGPALETSVDEVEALVIEALGTVQVEAVDLVWTERGGEDSGHGGATDGGTTDGGTADGGTTDGGPADAGTADGGTVDGGTVDDGDDGQSLGGSDPEPTGCGCSGGVPGPPWLALIGLGLLRRRRAQRAAGRSWGARTGPSSGV